MALNRTIISAFLVSILYIESTLSISYSQPQEVTVGAYYYPWWKNHFQVTKEGYLREELQPKQRIRLGEYDDTRPEVISQHLAWSRQANIGLWVSSWWGPNSAEDRTLRNVIMTHPDLGNHKIAIHYETTGRIKKSENWDTFRVEEDFEYICNQQKYISHPNYFHIHDRPVIVIYLTRLMQREGKLAEIISAVRGQCGDDIYIIGDHMWREAPEVSPGMDLLDAITNYDVYGNMRRQRYAGEEALDTLSENCLDWKNLANDFGIGFVPPVSPGYNDRAVRLASDNRAMSRKLDETSVEGSLFRAQLQKMMPLIDPLAGNLLMVNSFNEWHEDTQIEPCDGEAASLPSEYTTNLTYVGYGELYLDILREYTTTSGDNDGGGDGTGGIDMFEAFANFYEARLEETSTFPSLIPSKLPTASPSAVPSSSPFMRPSLVPSQPPSHLPSKLPTASPSAAPSNSPSRRQSLPPSESPSYFPSQISSSPPSNIPSLPPSNIPSPRPSVNPSISKSPIPFPSDIPSAYPSVVPTLTPRCSDSETWVSNDKRNRLTCSDMAAIKDTGESIEKECRKKKDSNGLTAYYACEVTCDNTKCHFLG